MPNATPLSSNLSIPLLFSPAPPCEHQLPCDFCIYRNTHSRYCGYSC